MFQSAANEITKLQAQALGLPLIHWDTKGEKEEELEDLKAALSFAKETYAIEGLVTGAIHSAYQSARIQKICYELQLWCINPLWETKDEAFVENLLVNKFKIMIVGIFSYPLDENYLGRILDEELFQELKELNKKYHISVAGEGGEMETIVVDAPLFKKRVKVEAYEKEYKNNCGFLKNIKARLEEK